MNKSNKIVFYYFISATPTPTKESGQQLAAEATSNKSIDSHTMAWQWQKQAAAANSNAITNQQWEQQKADSGWCWDHLREAVNN